MTVRSRRLQLGDVEITCDEAGEGDRPLVFVHGFTGHRDDFREILERDDGWGWLVSADLRGHGDASGRGGEADHDFDRLVEDLRVLLDTLGAERCDLLGHSMGGMLALRFTLRYPERVASLILMGTSPNRPVTMSAEFLGKAGELALREGMGALQRKAEAIGRQQSDRYLDLWGERYWVHHRKRMEAMDPAAYAALGRAMAEQESVVSRLAEIRCPTLVLVGEGDDMFLEGADLLERHIPRARRITIPDAGHHPHQENPPAFRAAVFEHLAAARGHEPLVQH